MFVNFAMFISCVSVVWQCFVITMTNNQFYIAILVLSLCDSYHFMYLPICKAEKLGCEDWAMA